MTNREILNERLNVIDTSGDLIKACNIWLDTDEKVGTMLKAFDGGLIKNNDDVLTKILEIEYGSDVLKK